MNEKQALIRETAQKFEALRPDMQQFVLGYMVARANCCTANTTTPADQPEQKKPA